MPSFRDLTAVLVTVTVKLVWVDKQLFYRQYRAHYFTLLQGVKTVYNFYTHPVFLLDFDPPPSDTHTTTTRRNQTHSHSCKSWHTNVVSHFLFTTNRECPRASGTPSLPRRNTSGTCSSSRCCTCWALRVLIKIRLVRRNRPLNEIWVSITVLKCVKPTNRASATAAAV